MFANKCYTNTSTIATFYDIQILFLAMFVLVAKDLAYTT